MPTYAGNTKNKWCLGNTKIKKIFMGTNKIYSSGNIVTYVVDSGISYQEEVEEGASCLSPQTFTPTKNGWQFVGWREDTEASLPALTSKVMEDNPITLYALFRSTVILSYNGNGATGGSTAAQSKYRYFNNSNIVNPSFTLSSNSFSRTSYTFSKWAMGGTAGTQYTAATTVTLSADTTMYAIWLANTLVVYNSAINNTEYVTVSTPQPDGKVISSIWYSTGSVSDSGTISIRYGQYKKATIVFSFTPNNTDVWYEGDRNASCWINGNVVYDSKDHILHTVRSYTYVGSETSIPIYVTAQNKQSSPPTWVGLEVKIQSITLSLT